MKKWQEKWKRMMSKPARYITECWGRKPQENEREERIGMENTSEIQNTVTNTKRGARRERLSYVMKFYSSSPKATISVIARFVFCRYSMIEIGLS